MHFPVMNILCPNCNKYLQKLDSINIAIEYQRVFRNLEKKTRRNCAKETGVVAGVDAIRDIMQDRAAGNGVTSAVGSVYEGGICLTLICTIKELLIFT